MRTEDGGRTWHKQLDGIKVAELMLAQATSMVSGSSEAQALAVDQAKRLVEDGPDKPFLALHVSTPEQALVIGAYGLALRTSDGGQHWSAATQIADNPGGLHYYSAAQVGNAQLLVGEQGCCYAVLRERPMSELLNLTRVRCSDASGKLGADARFRSSGQRREVSGWWHHLEAARQSAACLCSGSHTAVRRYHRPGC
ncbi:hypothetical protein EJJ20_31055 [Pseudomonas poae]|nr:hypothetical protein EJJ20_31055 [Pseudomonas poae]